jgi:NADH:ubiquinone oxidoreductase subunit 6 (subunit J)
MTLVAANPTAPGGGQLALATALAAAGVFLLLPRPRGRSVAGGIGALIAAIAVSAGWFHQTFGEPAADWIGQTLFTLFSCGAVGFGVVLVVQRNPARGAIAFAFVILSTCGLFLLLAAPFLMAATIIIYAGAIVVTFLFVLMLSATGVRSDENDRSREPLLGSLAGFAFIGLVLFALDESRTAEAKSPLPTPLLTAAEKRTLALADEQLRQIEGEAFYTNAIPKADRIAQITRTEELLDDVAGLLSAKIEGSMRYGSVHARLAGHRVDRQADQVLRQVETTRKDGTRTLALVETAVNEPNRVKPEEVRAEVRKLREEVVLLAGAGELPARNAANLGYVLYSQHLLSIELAGTLLLVATIGAIAIAHRKPLATPRGELR